eukprot:GHVS01068161.1.p1 GENE.GHVS01068161.1~~GHVS01068161.1.p1  ORF type:complete len:573 (-),score=87.39 GHVS01068161.1:1823-3541(-)
MLLFCSSREQTMARCSVYGMQTAAAIILLFALPAAALLGTETTNDEKTDASKDEVTTLANNKTIWMWNSIRYIFDWKSMKVETPVISRLHFIQRLDSYADMPNSLLVKKGDWILEYVVKKLGVSEPLATQIISTAELVEKEHRMASVIKSLLETWEELPSSETQSALQTTLQDEYNNLSYVNEYDDIIKLPDRDFMFGLFGVNGGRFKHRNAKADVAVGGVVAEQSNLTTTALRGGKRTCPTDARRTGGSRGGELCAATGDTIDARLLNVLGSQEFHDNCLRGSQFDDLTTFWEMMMDKSKFSRLVAQPEATPEWEKTRKANRMTFLEALDVFARTNKKIIEKNHLDWIFVEVVKSFIGDRILPYTMGQNVIAEGAWGSLDENLDLLIETTHKYLKSVNSAANLFPTMDDAKHEYDRLWQYGEFTDVVAAKTDVMFRSEVCGLFTLHTEELKPLDKAVEMKVKCNESRAVETSVCTEISPYDSQRYDNTAVMGEAAGGVGGASSSSLLQQQAAATRLRHNDETQYGQTTPATVVRPPRNYGKLDRPSLSAAHPRPPTGVHRNAAGKEKSPPP